MRWAIMSLELAEQMEQSYEECCQLWEKSKTAVVSAKTRSRTRIRPQLPCALPLALENSAQRQLQKCRSNISTES